MRRLVLACALAAACFAEAPADEQCEGAAGCACYGNHTCNDGLDCYMGERCVDPQCTPGTLDCPCNGTECNANLVCDVTCRPPGGSSGEATSATNAGTTSTSVTDAMSGTAESSTGTPQSCSQCAHAAVAADGPCDDAYQQCDVPDSGCPEVADCWIGGGTQCCDGDGRASAQLDAVTMCMRGACSSECMGEPDWQCAAGSSVCEACINDAAANDCKTQYDACDDCLPVITCFENDNPDCCNGLVEPPSYLVFMACARDVAGCGAGCTDDWDCQ